MTVALVNNNGGSSVTTCVVQDLYNSYQSSISALYTSYTNAASSQCTGGSTVTPFYPSVTLATSGSEKKKVGGKVGLIFGLLGFILCFI